jgi:hypothetical protein
MTNLEKIEERYNTLIEAYNEAVQHAIQNDDGCGLAFLETWVEGDWPKLAEEWPEFDLNSEAQQLLIKESGGMPK